MMRNLMQVRCCVLLCAVAFLPVLSAGVCVHADDDNEWAAKMFTKTSHDFGRVARGAEATVRIKLKNIYKETVHIAEVQTTCGCSAGKPSQETLKSLEEAYIEISMDTRKFIRRKDSTLVIIFDQPRRAKVQIPVTAYIRPDIVVEKGAARFGSVDREEKNALTLQIAYAGRSDWKLVDIRTNSKHVTAKAVETKRGDGLVNYDLNVTLSQDIPFGRFRQYMTLVTDDANSEFPLLVEADVKPDIVVSQPLISLGTLAPGQQKTVRVVLRGKKQFEVEAVTCRRVKDVFEVALPKTASKVHVIPLTITAPQTPGILKEELRVKVPGREEPVTFEVYARIGRG